METLPASTNDIDESYLMVMAILRESLRQLVELVTSKSFKDEVQGIHRACDKNYKGAVSYINRLFDKYSKLLVVRIDLSYGKNIDRNSTENKKLRDYFQAKSDFERFLSNQRHNSLFEHLVGYVWKLEHGPVRGYHYHVLLLFNGHEIKGDIILAQAIGEYWQHSITAGRGRYFNCNADKKRGQGYTHGSPTYFDYKYPCLGLRQYDDQVAMKGLDNIVAYFTKVDYYMRLKLPEMMQDGALVKGRTFGRGTLPSVKSSARGRVRGMARAVVGKASESG
jgi:hypothetical protein